MEPIQEGQRGQDPVVREDSDVAEPRGERLLSNSVAEDQSRAKDSSIASPTQVAQPGSSDSLKGQVRDFWNVQSCDTQVARASRFSREYFEQIEGFRYFDQSFIHSFAQFTRYRGKRLLEVGFGAGTDFIQWLRAGARVSGVDLTEEAIENVRHRIEVYGLPTPENLQVADAENLPFESDTFDLGYSFGVLHHTPNTEKALRELVRVIRPGGELKIMLYNRHSIAIINRWVRFGLLKGRPWRSLRWIMWNMIESPGTKGYTSRELIRMLTAARLRNIHVRTEITSADYLAASASAPLKWLYRRAIQLAGYHFGWLPGQYVERVNDPGSRTHTHLHAGDPHRALVTGNPLGFFHCISAEKEG
jgi:ubiquinone/menaquinone biosynthesis C-methylase UbiE